MRKLNRARLFVIGGAAVAIGVLVVSPAIGGPSLKSLVKKEVAKQLAGKTGPPGAQGIPGLPGAEGSPGPTAAGVANRNDPVASPDSINPTGSATVSAPTSGRILALASGTVTATCTSGNPTLGLFLEGTTPIPDTSIDLQSGVPAPFSIFGLTGAVGPGDHPIVFVVDCPSGNLSPSPSFANNKLGGILIGQ